MKRQNVLLGVSSATVLAIGGVGPVRAQTATAGAEALSPKPAATAPSDSQVGDIIVTAQRRSQSLNDVAATINVASGETLERRNVTSVNDLTKVVPGFTIAQNGDGTPIYTLRGISFNALNYAVPPAVSVSIDEAPIPFSVMAQGAIFDLDRVEVLKGPQGTLYGQNATGGAINYIAAKPTNAFEAGIDGTYSRFNTAQFEGFVSGPLSDTLEARVSASATRSGPWQYSGSRDEQVGNQRKVSGRLLLDWRPSDKLKLSINLNGWRDKSDTQQPQFVALRPGNPATLSPLIFPLPKTTGNARIADWDPNWPTSRNNRFYQGVLRADYNLTPNLQVTSLTSYSRVDINAFFNISGYPVPVQNYHNEAYIKAFNQEVRVAGSIPNTGVRFIVGANYSHDSSLENDLFDFSLNSAETDIFGFLNFNTVRSFSRQSNESYAAFANLDWDVTDSLTLSGGARYTHVRHDATSCTFDTGDGLASGTLTYIANFLRNANGLPPAAAIPAGACVTLGPTFTPYTQAQSFSEHNVPWRANLNYKINPDLSAYATISRGYKAGAYPVVSSSSYLTLQGVKQEQLTSYEAGVKARLFDRTLSINAAAYYYDYRDKQLLTSIIDPYFGLTFVTRNIPKSKVTGFDADVVWRPVRELTVRSGVTYADSKAGAYPDYDVFLNRVNDRGHQFNLAPKWTTTSDIEYDRHLSSRVTGYVGASVTHNSRSFADLASSPAMVIDAYTTLDLRAGVTLSNGLDVMVWGKNVTNTYYWNIANPGGDSVIRFASPPVTYGVTVRFKI